MANEISLVTASGSTVTPKDDGIIYEVFSTGNGIIYGGAVTIKNSSTLHITAGHGIVCGRKFTIDDSDIPVALSGSGSLLGRLYIHLDLADAADPITLLVETGASLTPVVQDADVNINNGVYEINIATFDVDTTTISNLVDVAPYLNTNGYEHEQIKNALGNTDISGIGDGSVTGAISELNSEKAGKVIDITVGNITTDTTQTFTINYSADNYFFVSFYFKDTYNRTYAPIHDSAIDSIIWTIANVTLIKKFPTAYQGKVLHFLIMPMI